MGVDALQQLGHARAQRGFRRAFHGLALVLGQQHAQRRVYLVLLRPLPATNRTTHSRRATLVARPP